MVRQIRVSLFRLFFQAKGPAGARLSVLASLTLRGLAMTLKADLPGQSGMGSFLGDKGALEGVRGDEMGFPLPAAFPGQVGRQSPNETLPKESCDSRSQVHPME